MRILLVNKFYYRRGGDCVYVLNLEKMLRDSGHDVAIYSMSYPDNLDSRYSSYFPPLVDASSLPGKILMSFRSLGTHTVRSSFKRLLDDFKPDVVHLNNIHSQISPVVAHVAKSRGIRVVWTLHDYKLLCPRYDCLSNGKTVCEKCFHDKRFVLAHSCLKDSRFASGVAYLEAKRWNRNLLERYTDIFICPSNFMRNSMISGGFSPEKLTVLNNFALLDEFPSSVEAEREDYFCYLGRLSAEKGIGTLMDAVASCPHHLKIIGDGPLRQTLPHSSSVDYLGRLEWDQIMPVVSKARFLVIPSEWYENNPLSVIEALCLGTPVLAADIGGLPELVSDGENGLLFKSGDIGNLIVKINEMFDIHFDYVDIARRSRMRFNPHVHIDELLKIYRDEKA